jgi:hypothetical protein
MRGGCRRGCEKYEKVRGVVHSENRDGGGLEGCGWGAWDNKGEDVGGYVWKEME